MSRADEMIADGENQKKKKSIPDGFWMMGATALAREL